MKFVDGFELVHSIAGRPRMGAWIEIMCPRFCTLFLVCRPRMGAWIEIGLIVLKIMVKIVAPAWGRGLK